MAYPWELQAWGNGRQQIKSIPPGCSLDIERHHFCLALSTSLEQDITAENRCYSLAHLMDLNSCSICVI